ncbi:MAG: hypothetical protein ACYTEL_09000 [Planctomycetota bacterium]
MAMTEKAFKSRSCLSMFLLLCLLYVPCCKKSSEDATSEDPKPGRENNTENVTNDVASPAGDQVLLEFELPNAVFVGTEEDIRVARLEPLEQPRPPFYAPAGTKNVAFGKPVTSTEKEPTTGDVGMVTDGDKEGVDGSFVELGPSPQTVTIDLLDTYEIYAILFWHYHKQPRAYYDVVVQVADDPDFIVNVRTLFNNDDDNSSGLGIGKDMHYVETHKGKLIDAKGVHARYVRLSSNGNSSEVYNHYTEVEVFGRPVR